MKKYNLATVFQNGFSLSDIDLLVKMKRAKFARKNGNTMVEMDMDACIDFMNEWDEMQKWKR